MTATENDRLIELLEGLCNGVITPEEAEELTGFLRSNAEARQCYTDYLSVHVALVSQARRGAVDSPPRAASAVLVASRGESSQTQGRWRRTAGLLASVAAVLLVALTLGSWWGAAERANGAGELADEQTTKTEGSRGNSASGGLYVAQLTNLSQDVTWGEGAASQEFLLRIRRGDRLVVSSGLVQIDYFSGAQVILHGPCAFVPTGESSGRLEHGQLTGQVSEGDFVLTTPTAKVIDLGTEFGVAVDDVAQTEVCVFDGEVRVYGGLHGDSDDASVLLREGMAARVLDGGHVSEATDVDAARFARTMPSDADQESDPRVISLVDLLSGSSRDKRRFAGVIAADTGESDRHPWLRVDGPGYSVAHGYQPTSWHPFVDGVFIPHKQGGKTAVDSSNHRVELPHSTGRTWGPIWSRSRIPGEALLESYDDYWGTGTLEVVIARLARCDTGMIGMHSNVGVTFDLDQIREQRSKTPRIFRSIVCNLDNSLSRHPEWAARQDLKADLRVYVDGELRSILLGFRREDGDLEVTAEISPEDRFLTLVCTDGGVHPETTANADAYDHVVLIDPVLEL